MYYTYRTPYLSSSSSVCYFYFIQNLDSKLSTLAPQPSPTNPLTIYSFPSPSLIPLSPFPFPFPRTASSKTPPHQIFLFEKKKPKTQMGLFTSPSSPSQQQPSHTTSPSPSPDGGGGFEAPDRSSRARCWRARDDFFACLERHGIVDGIKESERAAAVCGAEGRGFDSGCAASWVSGTMFLFFFFLWFLWFLWFLRGGGRWEDMGKRWGRKDKNG